MRAPPARILRGQHSGKGVDQFMAYRDEAGRFDPDRHAPAQRHQPARPRIGGSHAARQAVQAMLQLRLGRGRQMVEQRAMRVEDVALGREMLATQRVERTLIGAAEQGGHDDRGWLLAQIST